MFGPVVGNFLNSRREFLYEQCSLHITEKIPSSVKFGSRPRMHLMRSNSSSVSPCLATTSGVTVTSALELGIGTGTLANQSGGTNREFVRIAEFPISLKRRYE